MRTFLFLLVLGGALGGGYYWKYIHQAPPEEKPVLPTAKVERAPISLQVSATGRVVSNFDVEIKSKASGQIIALPYDVSDTVEKGKLLIELDPVDEKRMFGQSEVALTSSQAKLNQARLNLTIAEKKLQVEKERARTAATSAKARYEDAQLKASRLEKLWKEKLTSEEEKNTAVTTAIQLKGELENTQIRLKELEIEQLSLDLKKEDIILAEVQVKLDEINLSVAQQRVDETKIFAPIDGVVSNREIQIGQIISSGISNVGGGTALLTLSDLSHLFVVASVDESEIGKVKVDQKVVITADAYPGRRFEGVVVRIATKGISASNVVTFEVKIELTSRQKFLLKPEMTTNVNIIIEHREDALLIASEALQMKDRDKPKEGEKKELSEENKPKPENKEEKKGENTKEGPKKGEDGVTEAEGEPKKKREWGRKPVQYFVQLMKSDGTTEERDVEIGITDGVSVEILKGLAENDVVVLNKVEGQSSQWRQNSGRRGGMNPMMMPGGGGGRRGGR